MQYKGIDSYKIAEKYFNKKCTCCGKNIRNKDTIAMNLKMHGRNITRFMCKKCLMKPWNRSVQEDNTKNFRVHGWDEIYELIDKLEDF